MAEKKPARRIVLPTITKKDDGSAEVVAVQKFEQDDIPQDVLVEWGVQSVEFPDFWRALHFVTLQARQMSIKDCAKYAGISYAMLSSSKWRRLIGIARNMVIGQALLQAQSVTAYVFEEWPDIVRSIVSVAKNGKRDSDKVDAAELLHAMFINRVEPERDVSAEKAYLDTPQSFNPAQPLQIIQQNITVNNVQAIEAAVDYIDAEEITDPMAILRQAEEEGPAPNQEA